jgi:uncharacterized protein YifE (UPF0438 family)
VDYNYRRYKLIGLLPRLVWVDKMTDGGQDCSHDEHATPSLIAPYIKELQELERGIRVPQTALQVHFVEVCRGGAQPTTAYERAYLAWRAREQRRLKLEAEEQARRRGATTNRGDETAVVSSKPVSGRWSDPKPYARFVAEPLGTRADFKRDSGANFATSRRNKL